MAGAYPDPTMHRMAYDEDGTVVVSRDNTNLTTSILSSGQMQEMNDEDNGATSLISTSANLNAWIAFVFPELRNFDGYFFYGSGIDFLGALEKSTDTTNGVDGTWTVMANPFIQAGAVLPSLYRSPNAVSATNIKAVRFVYGLDSFSTSFVLAVHLYGTIAAASDRLEFWNPSSDVRISPAQFDFGDSPRSSSSTKQFRIKNRSATLTANNVTLSTQVFTEASPSVSGQMLFSSDNVTFTSTLNIGSLGPGSISGVLYAKKTTPSNAALSTWAGRYKAEASSWT